MLLVFLIFITSLFSTGTVLFLSLVICFCIFWNNSPCKSNWFSKKLWHVPSDLFNSFYNSLSVKYIITRMRYLFETETWNMWQYVIMCVQFRHVAACVLSKIKSSRWIFWKKPQNTIQRPLPRVVLTFLTHHRITICYSIKCNYFK